MSFNPAGGAVSGATDIAFSNPADEDVITYESSIGKWQNKTNPGLINATTTDYGRIILAGDLGGTAALPTVPGLATKAALSHTHTASNVTDLTETTQDIIGSTLTAGSNVTVTYNDAAGTVTIAAAGGATDLTSSTTGTTVTVVSSSGLDAILAAATTVNAGVMSAADKTKLDGVATAATANATDAQLRDRSTHTGAQAISTVTNLQTTLDGKAATTHAHAIADTTGLQAALTAKADNTITITGATSLTGGGSLSANRTISLVGDSATPGNSKYYGTNGTGSKGYYDIPAGDPAVGGDLSGTASNAQIVAGAVSATELATNAVTTIKVTDSAITEPKLNIANAPATNAVLSWDGTNMSWMARTVGNMVATNQTGNYTANQGEFVLCNAATAGFTVTLPAPVNGGQVSVKKVDSSGNAIIVDGPGAILIDDQITVVVNSQWQSQDFFSDGIKWYRI